MFSLFIHHIRLKIADGERQPDANPSKNEGHDKVASGEY